MSNLRLVPVRIAGPREHSSTMQRITNTHHRIKISEEELRPHIGDVT